MKKVLIGVLIGGFLVGSVLFILFFCNKNNKQDITSEDQGVELTTHTREERLIHEDHSAAENVIDKEIKEPVLYIGSYGGSSIYVSNGYRYIESNGLPNHETGDFPTRGNPNSISEQNYSFRVVVNPTYKNAVTPVRISGVALNGIPLEPGTAETYNDDIKWSIEAFGADGEGNLGIDWSNAHVQPNGAYHYHATPEGLLEKATRDQEGDLTQVAWAADGFPIYYSLSNSYKSSWQVKDGVRPDGPGGVYDGTYTEDFEYVAGSGDLDECNGIFIGDNYIYLVTDSFPYIQRCVYGEPDASFDHRNRLPSAVNGRPTPL